MDGWMDGYIDLILVTILLELKRRVRIIIIVITTIIIITYHHLHYYHHLVAWLVIQLSMFVMPQNEWWLRSTRESDR